jgi:hypothetical protein
VSIDTGREVLGSWKTARCGGSKKGIHGYEQATNIFLGYRYTTSGRSDKTPVEAWSNTSTVTLRVVGGNEKGSLESETVKYGHESYGTWTRK